MAFEPASRITRVVLKNYKSIVACDVELRPLTILVGPNGSGKSNFLDALRFVSDALNDGLETAVRKRGNMDSLLTRSALGDADARFRVELHLNLPDDRQGIFTLELGRPSPGGFRVIQEACSVSESQMTKPLSWFRAMRGDVEHFDSTTEHRLPLTSEPLLPFPRSLVV